MKDLKIDFSAVGDGVVDDTLSVQTALQWAAPARDVLYIPRGTYRITSQLTVKQGASFKVFGETRQGADWRTTLRWDGAPGGTMLLLDGCRDSEWSDFALDAYTAAKEPAVLLDIDKVSTGPWNSRKNAFRRMLLRGGSVATVRISQTTPVNNEANLFEDCGNFCVPGSTWVPGLGNAGPIGFQVKNVNAKCNQIVRCEISGKAYAVDVFDGSFRMRDTEISGCGTWVRNGGRGEPLVIDGCDGDSSRTFLEVTLTQTSPVIASGNRFYPHYQGPLFVFGDTIGPVTLLNNEFANGGYKAPADSYSSIAGNGPMVTAIGNTFPNDQILPVPGTSPPKLRSLYFLANMYYGVGNSRFLANDYLVPNRNTGQAITSLQIEGASGFPGETQALGAGNLINPNQGVVPITTSANITLNLYLPSIRPGMFQGQRLTVMNVGNFSCTLVDENTLPGSGVRLDAASITLAPKASAEFLWTPAFGGKWLQRGPVTSPL